MVRLNKIWNHPLYRENYEGLMKAETNRVFCKHDLTHLLDVARISYIMSLEEKSGDYAKINKEIIYAAALLHDIGRYAEISKGIPHEEAGAEIAYIIMKETDFNDEEIHIIIEAIRNHRTKATGNATALGALLKKADKASRQCFACEAYEECNWPEEKKNKTIKF